MNLKNLTFKQRIILVVGVTLLVVVLFGVFVLRPKISQVGQLRAQQREGGKKLEAAKLNLARLQAIKAEAMEIEKEQLKLNQRFPEDPDLPSLLVTLQDTANEAGIDFISISPGELAPQEGYSELSLGISISGTFFDVVDFLYRLEGLSREVRVDSVDIGVSDYPELSASISAKAFTVGGASQVSQPAQSQPPAEGGGTGAGGAETPPGT